MSVKYVLHQIPALVFRDTSVTIALRRPVCRNVNMEAFVLRLTHVLVDQGGLIQIVQLLYVDKLVAMGGIVQRQIYVHVRLIGLGLIAGYLCVNKIVKMVDFV